MEWAAHKRPFMSRQRHASYDIGTPRQAVLMLLRAMGHPLMAADDFATAEIFAGLLHRGAAIKMIFGDGLARRNN